MLHHMGHICTFPHPPDKPAGHSQGTLMTGQSGDYCEKTFRETRYLCRRGVLCLLQIHMDGNYPPVAVNVRTCIGATGQNLHGTITSSAAITSAESLSYSAANGILVLK